MKLKNKRYHKVVDKVENVLVNSTPIEIPIRHIFTPGLYCREMFMPAGVMITSKLHRTEHPFVVSSGRISVISEDNAVQEIEAPYIGITTPGTRRVIYSHTDTVWTTFHATHIQPKSDSQEDIEQAAQEIEDIIIEPYNNKLLNKKAKEAIQ